MKSTPPLLPLLRSQTQARLLAAMLLEPEQEHTVSEWAQLVGTSLPTATREVRRAQEAGIVTTRLVGGSRLAKAQPSSPLCAPLTELLLLTFGPEIVIREAFSKVPGVEEAYLFGSWAARYHGERGRRPADVDVLVVGKPDADALDRAIAAAEQRLRQPVDVTKRTAQQWHEGADALVTFVKTRPLVRVLPAEAGT